MKIALDSNVLVYLAGRATAEADLPKIDRILTILPMLRAQTELVAPVQAIGELFVVLRRTGSPLEEARDVVADATSGFLLAPSAHSTLEIALLLAVENRLQLWDSLILAAAAESGCTLLLSEDMQDGFVTRGVTIVNPFAEKLHPKLARLLT